MCSRCNTGTPPRTRREGRSSTASPLSPSWTAGKTPLRTLPRMRAARTQTGPPDDMHNKAINERRRWRWREKDDWIEREKDLPCELIVLPRPKPPQGNRGDACERDSLRVIHTHTHIHVCMSRSAAEMKRISQASRTTDNNRERANESRPTTYCL